MLIDEDDVDAAVWRSQFACDTIGDVLGDRGEPTGERLLLLMEVDGKSRRRDRPEPQPRVITVRGGNGLADVSDNEEGSHYGAGGCAHEPELLPVG